MRRISVVLTCMWAPCIGLDTLLYNLGMRLHISIFHSVGCFVDAIWKIESDFQLPFTYLLAVFVKIDNIIVMHMRTTCSCVGATRRAFLLEWILPLAVFSSNFILLTVLL